MYLYFGGTAFDAVHNLAFEGPPYPDPPTLASDLAFGDLNADGHTDLVIATYAGGGSAEAELVWVYLGEAVPDTVVDIRLTAVGQAEGVWVGDVNGDGFDDVAVYHVASNGNVGVALALGADQMDGAFDLFLPITPPEYVWSLDGGDLNLDGYADLIISVGQSNPGGPSAHKVLIYCGGDPMDSNPDVVMEGPPGFGEIVTFIGDMTGDGWPEFAVSNPEADGGRGEIYIYTMGEVGTEDGPPVKRDLVLRIIPNPTRGPAWIRFSGAGRPGATVGIYDLEGRLVRILTWDEDQTSSALWWDGRDAQSLAVPPGVYLTRLRGEQTWVATPIVVMR